MNQGGDNVVRLAASQPTRPLRACGSCEFYKRGSLGPLHGQCHALAIYACDARRGACANGEYWQPKRPGFWRSLGDAIVARIGGKRA